MGELCAYLQKTAADNSADAVNFFMDAMQSYPHYDKLQEAQNAGFNKLTSVLPSWLGGGAEVDDAPPVDFNATLQEHGPGMIKHMTGALTGQGWKAPYLVAGWQKAMDASRDSTGMVNAADVGEKYGRKLDPIQLGAIQLLPQFNNMQNYAIQEAVKRTGDWALKHKGLIAGIGIPAAGLIGTGINALFSRKPKQDATDADGSRRKPEWYEAANWRPQQPSVAENITQAALNRFGGG